MSDYLPALPTPTTTNLPPAALSSRPNALALAKALRRRWLLASLLGILAAALAGLGTWIFVPQKHMALTLVQVPQPFALVIDPRGPHTDLYAHQRNQISLVKSRLVLNKALSNPKVAELSVVREQTDPLDWLERRVQADFSIAPESMRISMTGDKPEELVTVVEAIRDAYLTEFHQKDRMERDDRLLLLSQYRDKYEKKLHDKKKYQQDAAVPRNATSRELRIHYAQVNYDRAMKDLDDNTRELRRLKFELEDLQSRESKLLSGELPDNVLQESIKDDRATQTLAAEVVKLQSQISTSRLAYDKKDFAPPIILLRNKLAAKLKELAALRRDILQSELRKEFVAIQTKRSIAEQERKLLEDECKNLGKNLEDLVNKVEAVEVMVEDTSIPQSILTKITAEIEALTLQQDAPSRPRILDPGYAKPPSGPTRSVTAAIGAMGGLILACFGVSWWEFRARRIETVEEVIQGLGLKLVGAIPEMSHGWFGSRRRQDPRAQHLFVESIDTTRTMLLEGARAESARLGEVSQPVPQVVMVTSAQSGEGKTSLSTHLAASLAQIGHRTLLIDADLRNPTAHRIIGLSGEPGCCELLRDEVELADVIRPTPIEGLWMITGGRWDNRATRALAQPHFGSLIQQLRADFEFILIDSSPILPVVDPLLLARHADIVLLSVLCNVSRMKNVYTACQRLAGVGTHAIRAVMSGVRGEAYDSSYQYFSSGQMQV
jgi:capsular exopolysaccharide synthesis family protein